MIILSLLVEFNEIFYFVFSSPSEFKLIGKVEENGWLCYVRNEIQALNLFNFQEAVIFMQKLANDAIPLKMLDQPITTSKK